MGAWLKEDLAPLVRGLLSESVVNRRGLFHSSRVQELIASHEANRIDGTDRLLALLNLEIWSRLYLDAGAGRRDRRTEGDAGMKILYLCHRFPFPPKRGGKIRPFNMIKHFSAAGHEVTVASLARSPDEAREGTGIAPYCTRYEMAEVHNPVQVARMLLRVPTPTPSSMGFFYSPVLAQRVRELMARGRFDLIFVIAPPWRSNVSAVHGIPKILDFGDMDSQKWLEYSRYKPFPLSGATC